MFANTPCTLSRDDHSVLKWNLLSGETSQLVKLPQDVFPTDLHWYPKSVGGKKTSQADIMVVTSTDGKLNVVV